MDAGLLDVLHHPSEEELLAVEDRVDVDLDRVVDEPVDQDRVLGADRGGAGDVALEGAVVVHDLHAAAAQHVRRADQHGVADVGGDRRCLVVGRRHAVQGRREAGLGQHPPEGAALLGEVDRLGRGADDRDTGVLQPLREPERGLAAELADHAGDRSDLLLGVHDLEHVLEGQRLEVEPV